MSNTQDIKFMREAILIAEAAKGKTSPDPLVGAILVKNDKIISVGYHGEVTTPHAEAWAIEKAGKDARGATLYVTLEPCCFFMEKNNPPCTKLIKKAGIKRVVAAIQDPNPRVNGRGFKELKKAGVEVKVGVLKDEARKLNEVFIKYIKTGMPFVTIKAAMSLDGKIATKSGESIWISGLESRKHVHYLRSINDAVMVGIGTVKKDDPELSVRYAEGEDPLRIIIDPSIEIPKKAKLLEKDPHKTIIICSGDASKEKIEKIKKTGAQVIPCPKIKNGRLDLKYALKKLGKRKITSILLEGGGETIAGAVEARVADKAVFFIAPKIIGGKQAPTPVEGEGCENLTQVVNLIDVKYERIGDDIMIEGYLNYA